MLIKTREWRYGKLYYYDKYRVIHLHYKTWHQVDIFIS